MPFSKKIETNNGILGIWELTETAEQLSSVFQFSEIEKNEFSRINFSKRKIEYLATRLLLQNLLNEKVEIVYKKSGKPTLKNKLLNISISHSADLAAVYISEKNNGIDVEQLHRNIDRVANRFLNELEMRDVENCKNPQMAKILYWGAKESIFKCTALHGVLFDKQIHIPAFNIENEGCFSGELISELKIEKFNLCYFQYKNNMVVYCVEE